jgi:hypothetical protein
MFPGFFYSEIFQEMAIVVWFTINRKQKTPEEMLRGFLKDVKQVFILPAR